MSQTESKSQARQHRYDAKRAGEIETKWQGEWEKRGTFRQPNPGEAGFDEGKPKFYCLDMFPYPSGAGLHVGHPEGYTATDIVCRYKRMRGFNVLHPMGWDAFGLPAEQYAVQTNVHPAKTTRAAIETFRRQLKRFGFCYDWSREFGTIDEDYYKWTQWIFLCLYDSWYDDEAAEHGRARPIKELIEELTSERILVAPDGDLMRRGVSRNVDALSPEPVGRRSFNELTAEEQRGVIDKQRLAYLSEQMVNWCPKLGTALANEEVIDGRSERGDYPVFRKPLRQWMLRITAYAERLVRDLEGLDWPHSTKTQQEEWIGRSEGAEVDFPLATEVSEADPFIRVYTTRPDTIFGATFMVVAPEHPLVDAVLANSTPEMDEPAVRAYVSAARNKTDVERQESKQKTGVALGVDAINPATARPIPVWVADYVLMGYGHGAIMAVPGQDDRDWEFAETFGLPIVRTVQPPEGFDESKAYLGDGPAINSGFLDGLGMADSKKRIIAWLEQEGIGNRKVNYKLHDWLFSRQRYWGEPFPIVFDDDGDHHPVRADALPVKLPPLDDFHPPESDDPQPLLAKATEWMFTTAGEAGVDGLEPDAPVRREANTMPNWAGSCWYYLRFCDPDNTERFVGRDAERYWMNGGIDLYIGGNEHAVLHLLYARFWHKVLYDLGEVATPEPFQKLFHQGLITSFAFKDATGRTVPVDEVDERAEGEFVLKATGDRVEQIVAKMSKTLKNVINPDDIIAEYGADTFRIYEMYMGPLEASKPWNTRDIIGLFRFLQRAWRLCVNEDTGESTLTQSPNDDVERMLHRAIAKVGHDVEHLAFNTAIASMIELVNAATSAGGMTADQLGRFATILSPFAPHIAEEMWSRLGHDSLVCDQPWPAYDEAMLVDDQIEIPVQIKGKVRAKIVVAADADQATIEAAALADEKVQAYLEGKQPRKVIVVPGKMVNIVPG